MSGEVKIYRVEGRMRIGDAWQRFTLEYRALKPEHAIERAYAELGSRHKLKRPHIKIEKVYEIPPEEVTKPYMIKLLEYVELFRGGE